MEIAIDTSIVAPPAAVFALYTDPERRSEWRRHSHGEVIRSKRPYIHVLAGGGAVKHEALLRLAPTMRGTDLQLRLELQLPGGAVGRTLAKLVLASRLRRRARNEMENLKRIAEREAAPVAAPRATQRAAGPRRLTPQSAR